jgi:hypothetical protein
MRLEHSENEPNCLCSNCSYLGKSSNDLFDQTNETITKFVTEFNSCISINSITFNTTGTNNFAHVFYNIITALNVTDDDDKNIVNTQCLSNLRLNGSFIKCDNILFYEAYY